MDIRRNNKQTSLIHIRDQLDRLTAAGADSGPTVKEKRRVRTKVLGDPVKIDRIIQFPQPREADQCDSRIRRTASKPPRRRDSLFEVNSRSLRNAELRTQQRGRLDYQISRVNRYGRIVTC